MAGNRIDIIIRQIEKKNYHLFIGIGIGKKQARLLIDTGASKTVFDSKRILKFVKKEMLKSMHATSVGLGTSEVETQVVSLKNLQFGQRKVRKMEVAVLDLSHVNGSYKLLGIDRIDGVLGSDFLMKYKAIINFGKKKLTLQ